MPQQPICYVTLYYVSSVTQSELGGIGSCSLSLERTFFCATASCGISSVQTEVPVQLAARSKTWVCGRSPAEIVGSNPTGGTDVCLLWVLCVLSGRGFYDELITRPEESYWLWCVVVCDLETSWLRRLWPTEGCSVQNKQRELTTCTMRCSIPIPLHTKCKTFLCSLLVYTLSIIHSNAQIQTAFGQY